MRIGLGYDVHKLVEDRQLIIGGVNIPHEKGLLGHSDADVLIHAIMDSILGALALGDIGKHFPDTNERYKGADSMKLLKCVNNLINEKGYGKTCDEFYIKGTFYETRRIDLYDLRKFEERMYAFSFKCRKNFAL